MARALNRKLLRDIRTLRTQVVAITVVVACGVATFVGLRSVYASLLRTQSSYYELYRFADIFANLERAPESLEHRIAEIPGVGAVQTRVVSEVTLDVPGLDEPATGRLVSIPEEPRATLNDLYIQTGGYIEGPDDVLASASFAEANALQVGDSLGAVINGRWRRLRIAGIALSPEYVYEIRGAGELFPDNRLFGVLWIGRETVAAAFDLEGAFNDVALTLAPGGDEEAVIARLDTLLERYGGFGAYGREDQISNRFLSDEIAQSRTTSVVVPAIFLGVAAFLLHVVLVRLVATQREQIAVLKAFGYSNAAVGLHYLALSLVAVAGGAVVGPALGIWIGYEMAQIYAQFYRFPVLEYAVSPLLVAAAVGINAAAASLGAYSAVRRAVSLPPAEAMRAEPPARFGPGIVDRLHLQRFFSPAARMVIRNLERRPVRALVTTFGIGLAVAILVVGGFFFDAIDYMARIQFQVIQREDVAVTFEAPLPLRVRHELDALPGVMRTEVFRSLPVRLRHEHRSYQTALLGQEPGAELRRRIDREERPIPLPASGLLLSTHLAEILDVKPGEMLTVEVQEGEQREVRLPVAGVVDELIGLGAYMTLDAVNRVARGEPSASGAYLAVDPLYTDTLYARLKRLPAVAGVAIRESSLQSFQETLAQSILISTVVIVIFAVVIAFGIVYNGARITLSERMNELATLRILGFYRREVAGILLGEQALLTIVALPVGFLLGYVGAATLIEASASELFRLPLIVTGSTYVFAGLVVSAAAVVSGLAVRRRLDRIDLIEALKGRE